MRAAVDQAARIAFMSIEPSEGHSNSAADRSLQSAAGVAVFIAFAASNTSFDSCVESNMSGLS